MPVTGGGKGATAVVEGSRTQTAGDPVVTLQAMKMEIEVASEHAGTVEQILVAEGQEVEMGAVLARVRRS